MRPDARRVGALFVVTLILTLIPAGAGAPWLQWGHDPGRTGAALDAGPPEVLHAFHALLPGGRAMYATPIILDRTVYVATWDVPTRDDLESNALHAIDLDTAETRIVVEWEEPPHAIAANDTHFFVVFADHVAAIDLAGERTWTVALPSVLEEAVTERVCVSPAVESDTLYVGCTEVVREGAADAVVSQAVAPSKIARSEVVVVSINTTTGGLLWTWNTMAGRQDQEPPSVPPSLARPVVVSASPRLVSVTVVEATTYVLMAQVDDESGIMTVLEVLGPDGARIRSYDEAFFTRYSFVDPNDPRHKYPNAPPPALVANEEVFMLLDVQGRLFVFATEDGRMLSNSGIEPVVEPSLYTVVSGSGIALALEPDRVIVVFGDRVRCFPLQGDEPYRDLGEGRPECDVQVRDLDGTTEVVAAAGRVYVISNYRQELTVIGRDGEILRQWTFNLTPLQAASAASNPYNLHGHPWFRSAIGDGAFVVAMRDGRVSIFGESDASVRFEVRPEHSYPTPGQPFEIALIEEDPGVLGSKVTYRIDWGDGTRERVSPGRLAHSYAASGDHTIRVRAENDGYQEALRSTVVHVGATPPVPPTFLESAFSQQYQDTTWGIIGLLVVVLSALVAVLGMRRRRSILRAELQAIEDAARTSDGASGKLDRVMAERRQHVRELLLHGKIDEPQFSVLDGRITELLRSGRLGILEERLTFLPHGMAQTLRRMLADGHINDWEHEAILRLLDQDPFLTRTQKRMVREQIKRWRQHDVD